MGCGKRFFSKWWPEYWTMFRIWSMKGFNESNKVCKLLLNQQLHAHNRVCKCSKFTLKGIGTVSGEFFMPCLKFSIRYYGISNEHMKCECHILSYT
jgi:hypothetical protein